MKTGETYDDETIAKAKEVTKNYIANNYENIQSMELEDPYTSPMGAMKVNGTVNNEIGFSITLHDDFTIAGISTDEGFPEEKEECKKQDCNY